MALNWTMLNADRAPVPLPYETIIRSIDSGADIVLSIPDIPPTGSTGSGGSGGVKKLKDTGRLWLTDKRVRVIQLCFARVSSLGLPRLSSSSFR